MERDYYSVATVYPINYRLPNYTSINAHLFLSRDGVNFLYNDRDAIYQMALSTPFDFSSMSFVRAVDIYGSTKMPNLQHQWMSPDGTRLFGVYIYSGGKASQFDLTTAWDLSSIQLASKKTFSLGSDYPSCMFMTEDGSKLYVLYSSRYKVNHYSLSTAFDITSAALEYTISLASTDWIEYEDDNITKALQAGGFTMSADGTRVFLCSTQGAISEIRLASAWDWRTRTQTDWPVFPFNEYGDVLDSFPDYYPDSVSIGSSLGELFCCGFNYDLNKGCVVRFTGTPLPGGEPSASQFWTNFNGQTEIL